MIFFTIFLLQFSKNYTRPNPQKYRRTNSSHFRPKSIFVNKQFWLLLFDSAMRTDCIQRLLGLWPINVQKFWFGNLFRWCIESEAALVQKQPLIKMSILYLGKIFSLILTFDSFSVSFSFCYFDVSINRLEINTT